MRTNLVQTYKTSANRINLNRTAMRVALIGLFISLGITNAWGGNSDYKSTLTVSVETGAGTVYVGKTTSYEGGSDKNSKAYTQTTSGTSAATHTFYIKAVPDTDYRFSEWTFGGTWATKPTATTAATNGQMSSGTTPVTATAQASFAQISIASVIPATVTLTPTDARTSCSDYTGSVVFTTSNDNAASQIGTPTFGSKTGSGTWNATNDWAAGTSTVTYTFKGNGYYGGSSTSSGSRSNSATLTLPTAGGTSSKSVTFTANFPSLVLSDATENNKAYPINPTTDGTGTVVFPVQYCDGAFDFKASITGASEGTFTPGTISFTQTNAATGSGNITVPFTFNAGGATGDFSATLTLTPQANTGGTAKSVTITAYAEEEATNAVSVTTAAGVTTEYATWAAGLAATNASAGSTLKLLRNIDLGTITATNNITQAITIDLNGKELRAAVNATSVGVLTITAAVPVTIKDSKTGGKIINEIARNSEIRTIFVNKAGATLTLESGTIAVNNLGQYASAAATVNGVAVAKYASCSARAIHQNAGTTVNINGGRVEAHGTRSVYGIVQASSVATNKAGTTVLNITGGEIYAEAPYGAYGLQGYGKVNFSGGNINVKANTNMVDASYAADNVNNKYNGLIYGISISAYANATATSCYYGTLNMTGGNINVTNERVYAVDRKSYGVLIDCTNANMGANTAVDGSKCQKAAAKGSIDGGTITVNSGTYYSFGVYMSGSYNSYDSTSHVLTVKNCAIDVKAHTYAYGVFSQGAVNSTNGGCYHGDIELTNCDVTAETTVGAYSYAAFVTSRVATIFKNASTDAANYYHGEYGSAGKLTINSGTYKAYSKTTTAYCVSAGNEWGGEARARTVYADETNVPLTQHLGGNVEAYPTLIIHGGDFYAETYGTTHARAVSSGGHTIIDGGTFKAVAKTNNAYGLMAVSGTMKATGITVEAEGNATVYGVLVNAGISDYTMFDYAADVELNNCDVTATTRTGTEARGVSVTATTKTQTEATREALSDSNKNKYYNLYQITEKSAAGKVKINGGTYRATAATTTAYGVLLTTTSVSTTGAASASTEGIIKNATFVVKTNGTTSATGIYAGGSATIDGCNITVQPKTTTGYGVYINDKKTTLSNTTINVTTANTADATKSAAAYGIYNNASISSIGWIFEGELEANEGNVVDVKTTSGTTAYGVYTHAVNKPVTSEVYTTAGTYVAAARTTINGGKYTAHANNTTGYAVGVADPVLGTEVTDIPTCIINGGKFKGTAGAAPFADVSVNGEPGYFVLNGGYYVKDENLDKKLGEGMNKVAVNSGTPEYTEGYRWRVTDNMTGEYVCKIKENSTSYASLEEALQVVNADPNSTWTIIMIANYTLSKGDYVLPANTTLLIPYYSTQTAINGAAPTYTSPVKNVEQYEAPSPLYKLTFANGVNMSVYGKIEASAVTYLSNQGLLTHGTGVVSGKYGWLYLNEGSHIDLENGSALYAWGYVTGKGEINAKNGSTVYEDFQMGDWRGGTEEKDVQGNTNGLDNKGVFLITHYYYQNIECPITYRAGAQGFAHGGTYMYMQYVADDKVPTQTAVKMIGTSDAMFLMDPATAGEDTWVRKEYDAETDYVNWTMNSGAKLGSVRLKMKLPFLGQIDLSSSDYVLPITSNFNIIANDGEIQITNHVCFIPGSKLTIKKEGTLTIPSPQRVFFYDQDDWLSYGGYWFHPYYSPSWKVNPRVATIGDKSKIKMPDAEVLVEGLLNVGGAIYTTAGGANIHSTRENAGKVKFGAAPPDPTAATGEKTGNTTLYQWIANGPKYDGKALNPAWLKNENGKYSTPTSDTKAGDTWVYMQSLTEDTYEWTKASEDGCFTVRSTGDTKTYVHPSDWVAVGAVNANHAYPSEDSTRMFVNTEAASTDASCKWWDVNPKPDTIDGVIYYVANNENFDNFGTYYYWDNETSYWKPKKITVTWKNYDGSKLENGTYGDEYNFNTSPQFYGTNPTKTNTTVEKYDWIGWRDEEGNIYDKNATLPRAKSNVTYTAYFNTTKYQYTITFKNDDNSDLWAGLVDAGTTGAELQALFKQKYNEKTGNTDPQKAPTVDSVFIFDQWYPALVTVEAAATYTAQYSRSPRQYHVTFYNYDAVSVLYEADVDYNANPVYGGVTPFRANTSAYSYDWTGWKQGTNTYGTSVALPVVKGDISYIATFEQTELKYQVLFKRQDGSIIDAPFFSYEEKPDAFPANPTMASTVSTDYTFREWSPATLEPVTEDGKVYTALFDESPRKYTAHFVNYNGVSLNKDQTIDYNKVPEYTGATPFKPNDARNSYVFSGWAWTAGDGWEAGSIAAGEAFPAIKGNITFTAQFTPTLLQLDAGFYVDIVDVDNSEKTLKLNVSGTEWVTAGWPYEVNGTVYYRDQAKATAVGSDKYRATDRTLTIPYTGEPGENFTVTIRNASSTLVSKHTYIIPQEIKSATTLTTDQTAPIFVKGATLTVNADIEATNIYVGHDAKLVINSGVTLTADSLFLRTKPESAAELVINESGAVAGSTKVLYTRIILSKSGYFQFGLPLSCPISAVRLSNGKTVGYKSGTGWILRYYDEDKRATTGPGDNWATLDAAASIAAGRGYEMYSGVDYYREFYFPVDLSQMTNIVHVDYTAGEQPTNNGWNVLVSPLTHTFTNTPQPEGMKISWMQLDGSFLQEPLTTVAPAMTFAYQAVKEGSLVFDGSNVTVPTLAPRRVAAVEEATRIQWMHLDIKDANGLGDQTSIYSHPTRYEQTYKTGIDVAKQSLTASRALLYSSHAYGEMAFAGVADELLEQGVALTVYSPKAQELTISMRENEWLNRMVSVWLIDKATGAQIDLLESDYSFSAEAGTTAGRFILMGAFFAPQITTDNGTVQGDEDIKAKKFIYKDKMYIQINGVIYDATGKLVK